MLVGGIPKILYTQLRQLPVDGSGSIHKTFSPMLHCLPKGVVGGSSIRQQRLVGLDLLQQSLLSLLGAVQRLSQRGQLQLEIRVGVLGGAELLAPLSEKTLQLTMGGSILLALTLERGKILAALLDVRL